MGYKYELQFKSYDDRIRGNQDNDWTPEKRQRQAQEFFHEIVTENDYDTIEDRCKYQWTSAIAYARARHAIGIRSADYDWESN